MINLADQYKNLLTIDIKDLHQNAGGDSLISEVATEPTSPIASTVNRLETFIEAIKKKDIHYFDRFQSTIYTEFYQELREAFYEGRILKKYLANYFNALEGTKYSSIAFMRKLRSIDDKFFNDKLNLKNVKKPNSKYSINSIYNEFQLPEKEEGNKVITVHSLR